MKRRDLIWLAPSIASAIVQEAPDYHANTLAKARFTRASLKGKVVLVQFWATWCGFCRRDQEPIDEIYMDLAGKGLEVLAVNMREPEKKVRAYLRETPRVVPVVLSPETNLAEIFQPTGFPAYVAINREGRVAATTKGAQGRDGLLALLARAGVA
jgi:cytochrome c biogenesis protein CcmG, thiol:disulfide interchange protein DsbE